MHIAIAQVSHETNTCFSELTDQTAFSIRSWIAGDERSGGPGHAA